MSGLHCDDPASLPDDGYAVKALVTHLPHQLGGKRASGVPPSISTSSEPGNHLNPGPNPANPPPIKGTLPEDSGKAGGQVERGSLVAQVSQAIPRTAVR